MILKPLFSKLKFKLKFKKKKNLNFKDIKIALIGGGTGLSNAILGLKKYNKNLSAIVAVSDDGGSSGKLREEFDIIPPGDIRNCLVAMADKDFLLAKLFDYRFNIPNKSSKFNGHSFGNLFILALSEVFGSFEKGIIEANKILLTRGKVIPSSFEKIKLLARKIFNGEKTGIIKGESNIVSTLGEISDIWLEPSSPKASRIAIKSILDADIIIIGPGSFYSSIISNLLIKDITDSIKKNKKAIKIFVCNIMEQNGETNNLKVLDYLNILEKYLGKGILDFILVSDNSSLPKNLLKKYFSFKQKPVMDNLTEEICKQKKIKKISVKFLKNKKDLYLRHDPILLAKVIKEVFYLKKNI